jgi:hypothetical protein
VGPLFRVEPGSQTARCATWSLTLLLDLAVRLCQVTLASGAVYFGGISS